MAGHGVEVSDLMQEVSLALWKNREHFLSLGQSPRQAAWVWKVARNAAIDYRRSHRVEEAMPAGIDLPTEDRSLVDALYEQIRLLDEPDKSIVTLQLQGYSYNEIAERLKISEKNVSVRLVRIKEKLKKGLLR